jgi:hypothetical protein
MSEDKKGFVLYKDWAITILEHMDDESDPLSPSEAGLLLKAILKYQAFGEDSRNELPKHLRYLFKDIVDVFNRDLEKWEKTREKRKQSGKLGGLAKASKPSKCYDLPKTEKKEKPPSEEVSKVPKVKPASLFDDFYNLYPKKVGKQQAIKAYNKAIKSTDHQAIIEGVKNYKIQIASKKIEMQYIKQPATWLNAGCWDDDFTDIKTKTSISDDWANEPEGLSYGF